MVGTPRDGLRGAVASRLNGRGRVGWAGRCWIWLSARFAHGRPLWAFVGPRMWFTRYRGNPVEPINMRQLPRLVPTPQSIRWSHPKNAINSNTINQLRRKPVPPWKILEATLLILNTGAQWHMRPQCHPSYKTAHRRFQTWCRSQVPRRVLTDIASDVKKPRATVPARRPIALPEARPISRATTPSPERSHGLLNGSRAHCGADTRKVQARSWIATVSITRPMSARAAARRCKWSATSMSRNRTGAPTSSAKVSSSRSASLWISHQRSATRASAWAANSPQRKRM